MDESYLSNNEMMHQKYDLKGEKNFETYSSMIHTFLSMNNTSYL